MALAECGRSLNSIIILIHILMIRKKVQQNPRRYGPVRGKWCVNLAFCKKEEGKEHH